MLYGTFFNACRLYMNVTMLSDITRPDGRSIEKWAYEGSYPAHTTMDYPRRPRPAPGSIMEDLEACNLLNIFDQGQNQRLLPTEYPTEKNTKSKETENKETTPATRCHQCAVRIL